MNKIKCFKRALSFIFVFLIYILPLAGQDILVTYRNGIGEPTKVGVFNPSECAFSTVDTLLASSLGMPFFSYTPAGDLYVLDGQAGDFYSVDLNDGSLSYVGSFATNFGEIQFVNDSIFYAIRLSGMSGALGIANVNTGETEILEEMQTAPVSYGFGLTIRNDSLFYGDGFGIHYMDRSNFQNSELVIPVDFFGEGVIDDMVTLQLSCDSTITYGFRWSTSEDRYFMDIIDFDNQQRIDIGCELPHRIRATATPLELTPPPCPVVLDLDEDNSTAPLLAFQADTVCAPSSLPIADGDAVFSSALGFVDSVRVTLADTPDGTAEALTFLGADSIQAAGSGSSLLLTAPLRPSLEAWEAALQALRYTNSAMPPQSGVRQVRFIAYAANNVSDTAVAYLPIYSSTPSAGEDSSLSLCPDAPAADLFAALGGNPEAGGQWQPGTGTFDPAVDVPGGYLYIQSSPGCPPDTAVVSVSITPAPAFSLGADTLLCAGESLLLEAPAGLGAYEWSDGSPGGSLSVSAPGTYWLEAGNAAGCRSRDSISVAYSDFSGIILQPSPALCQGGSNGSIEVFLQGGQAPYTYDWGTVSGGNPLLNLPAGSYSVTVTDADGCTQSGSTTVTEPQQPLSATDSLQLCAGESYDWQGQPISSDTLLSADYVTADGCDSVYRLRLRFADTILIEEEAAVCPGGTYTWQGQILAQDTSLCLTYTSSVGCDSTHCLSLRLEESPQPALPDSVFLCAGGSIELQAGTPGTYLWSDGSQEERLLADELGTYSLTVTNSAGCRAEDSTLVLPAPPLMAAFSLVPPRCVGDTDGEIAVGSLSGGSPPYTYQLEGEAPQDIPLFEGLPAGTYSISIQDGEGCRLDTLLQLPAPVPVVADAGPDQSLPQGGGTLLQGSTNLLNPSVQWSPAEYLSCDTCLATTASPPGTQLFQLMVTDSLGCSAIDEVLVTVEEQRGFAMPNAFSPNDDGRNDVFGPVFSVQELRVRRFMVFNRWGALVHERENLPITAPRLPWDGTFRGQAAPVEVYAYYIEIEWPDGQVQRVKGDVSLLR